MLKLKFEYKITLAYIILGIFWIISSDRLLGFVTDDTNLLTRIQTFKGWFYVFVTALLFFLFLKRHLNKLRETENEVERHKDNLKQLVIEKTRSLDEAINELSQKNKQMADKNEIINSKNEELNGTLQDLKSMQDQLLQVEKMASIGVLTSGVAHEINNPLNYILGGLTGLEQYFEENNNKDEKIDLYLSSIKTGIERVNSIVSGLNQLSKSKDSSQKENDITSIIENCLTIINSQITDRISLKKDYPTQGLIVYGNTGDLQQIFLNILLNAVQAIEDKGIITISAHSEDNNISIQIADTGCGIGRENISRITDPFFTTKDPGKGTGLGLSIAYSLIIAHNGNLRFKSEPNKGTTVKITLPNKKTKDAKNENSIR